MVASRGRFTLLCSLCASVPSNHRSLQLSNLIFRLESCRDRKNALNRKRRMWALVRESAGEYEVLELTSPGRWRRSSQKEDSLWEGGGREGAGGDAPEDGGTGAKIAEQAQNLPNTKGKRLIGWCRRSKLASLSYNKCSVAGLFTFQEKCRLQCVFLEFSC